MVLVKRADGAIEEHEGVSFQISDTGDQVFIHAEDGRCVSHALLNPGDVVGVAEPPVEQE